jgi:hypothetical protein
VLEDIPPDQSLNVLALEGRLDNGAFNHHIIRKYKPNRVLITLDGSSMMAC